MVRTVLGDIPATQLGATTVHEHLLMSDPALPGDELDDLARSTEEARSLRACGVAALVELTPLGLGRDPDGLRRIAQTTGLNIVMATGLHADPHYSDSHWTRRRDPEALAEHLIEDIAAAATSDTEDGSRRCDEVVRAGIIKVGVGYWSISRTEQRSLEAAAIAHRQTGAAITCHLEHGTLAHEVLDLLAAADVPSDRVILAHIDRNLDPDLHLELATRGAYLSYDGCGHAHRWPDSMQVDCLLDVANRGGANRLLLGSDRARASAFHAYGGHPGLTYLPRRFIPRVERGGGAQLVKQILVDNPARVVALCSSQHLS